MQSWVPRWCSNPIKSSVLPYYLFQLSPGLEERDLTKYSVTKHYQAKMLPTNSITANGKGFILFLPDLPSYEWEDRFRETKSLTCSRKLKLRSQVWLKLIRLPNPVFSPQSYSVNFNEQEGGERGEFSITKLILSCRLVHSVRTVRLTKQNEKLSMWIESKIHKHFIEVLFSARRFFC